MNKEYLNELFKYEEGKLFWKITRPGRPIGSEAGSFNKGYKWLKTDQLDRLLSVHKAIWIMHNGDVPEGMVLDHINRDPSDNRLENLRLVTRSQNAMNAKGKHGKKSTLPKNVARDWEYKGDVRYRAQLCKEGVTYRVGNMKTIEEADEMAQLLRQELFGEYALKEE